MATEAFFLDADGAAGGQRLGLLHTPDDRAPRAAIVYVHPFAEEMNKSRRMAALQSRAFAAAGCAVLQLDLLGCGDSSGDFGDAGWSDWVDDVLQACRWLRARVDAPLTLWGLRCGALLATEAAQQLAQPCRLLLWQPVLAGKTTLQQFLRLEMAAALAGGDGRTGGQPLRERLAAGETIEVAGYRLSPALAAGLERATLALPAHVEHCHWLELSTRDDAVLSPASARTVAQWRQGGASVDAAVVPGPSFWQTTEIEEAPALLAASLAAVDREAVAA